MKKKKNLIWLFDIRKTLYTSACFSWFFSCQLILDDAHPAGNSLINSFAIPKLRPLLTHSCTHPVRSFTHFLAINSLALIIALSDSNPHSPTRPRHLPLLLCAPSSPSPFPPPAASHLASPSRLMVMSVFPLICLTTRIGSS